jgi:hypothetical protein
MKSILENIKDAVYQINWGTESKKEKAIQVCEYIYNLYIYDGGDFHQYRSLGKQYFQDIIKTQRYVYEIKNLLIESGILEIHNSYDVKRHISKGYRFNQELIKGKYVVLCGTKTKDEEVLCGTKENSITEIFANSIHSTSKFNSIYNFNQFNSLHICGTKVKPFIYKGLQKINFDPKVHNWINEFTLTIDDLVINDEINEEYVDIVFENDTFRYGIDKARSLANQLNKSLIGYNDKFYIDTTESFIHRKSNDLRLVYSKSVFDIENGIFRCSRNETNRRLDYNLTNMKSDLLNFIRIDGERLIELDIANAQFAILSFITDHLDEEFIKQSENGTLYDSVNKKKMFRVAFDKIKSEQDDVRNIFPKTMKMIDEFKHQWGYKSFSNLLQNVESLIMIDGLLPKLISKNLQVFPIHDAIRVKESDLNKAKHIILEYFKEIGFKCKLRAKDKSEPKKTAEQIEILYKGYEKVMIDKPTKEDKELFLQKIDELGIDAPEWMVMSTRIFEKNKLWYFYSKWRDKTPFSFCEEK